MIDAIDQVKQFDKTGKLIREISLPGKGNISGFGGKKKKKNYTFHLVIILLRELPTNLMQIQGLLNFSETQSEI